MTAVKIIKVLGTSTESWEEAAREAVRQAAESVEGFAGSKDGEVTEYRSTVEIAFPVHEQV